jgi:hypothetical protein
MGLHLAEISLAIAPGAHALVLMDQAGWHTTGKLQVPGNITIVPLPAKLRISQKSDSCFAKSRTSASVNPGQLV